MICICCEVNLASQGEDECDECIKLLVIAEQAISIARRVGVPKYGPSSWKEIPTNEHLEHAANHVMDFIFNKKGDEDHLAHAICRLVMARANENTSSS